jgi:cytochrome c-type biogenesis protein CcmH
MAVVVAVLIALGTLAYLGYPLLMRDRSYAPEQTDVLALVAELSAEKETLIQAIKDLEFDLACGKLSPADYDALRSKYERRAVAVLAQLETQEAVLQAHLPTTASRQVAASGPGRIPRHVWARPVFAISVLGMLVLIAGGGGFLLGRVSQDEGAGAMSRGDGQERGNAPVVALEARLKQNPHDVEALVGLGRIYLQGGQLSRAIEMYKRALEMDGSNVSALSGMAMILAQAGHNEQALTLFDKVLAINPQFPMALLFKGRILYEDKQDYAGAIAHWERFLAMMPEGERAGIVRGWIEEARQEARKAGGDGQSTRTP